MNIGIIGAGFTGLAAGYYLSKKGHKVKIFEKDKSPGGLAIGYKEKGWKWTLESHYHHWFTNDDEILSLAKEIDHKVIIKRPTTSSFVNGNIYQLDSPISLLKFPELNLFERLRTGFSLAFLKFNPYWQPLENFHAESYLKKTMGRKSYKKIWEPLLKNKLGEYADTVSLAWFWARIYKRTESLAYPESGFLEFAKNLENKININHGEIYYNSEIEKISSDKNPTVRYSRLGKSAEEEFDKIIVTLPTTLFIKIATSLPSAYAKKHLALKSIGATNLVMRLKKPFLPDNTYWLNMCDLSSPILAIVEHTNFMDKKKYNGEHIVYLGNYMNTTDRKFNMNKNELLKLYDPWLKKINPDYQKNVIDTELFKAPYAQPIIPPKYSAKIPPFQTPLKNVFLANIQQVYPWDRGTNYAVELGRKISELLT